MRMTCVFAAAVLAAGCCSCGKSDRSSSGSGVEGSTPPPSSEPPPGSGDPPSFPTDPGSATKELPAALLPVEAGIATADRPCAGGWCWWNFPRGAPITSMWGSGPGDVWATTSLGGMLHYDGESWSAEWLGIVFGPDDTLVPFVGFDVGNVWGKSASAAFANDRLGSVLRWDGTGWTRGTRYTFSPTSNVSSSQGIAWTSGGPVLHRFDGITAETIPVPGDIAGVAHDDVRDVWAAGPDDVFATSKVYGFDSNGPALFVIRHHGGEWEGELLSGGLGLNWLGGGSLSGSGPDDVWVSAWAPASERLSWSKPSTAGSTLWRFDGSRWSALDPAIWGPVFVAAPGDVWVGKFHLAGGAWTEVADAPDHVFWSSGARDVWGVQDDDLSTLVHWNGERWTARAHLGGDLRVIGRNLAPAEAAWALAPTDDGGAELLRWDGAAWARIPGSHLGHAEVQLLGMATYGSSERDVWLSHRDGYLRWDGARWTLTSLELSVEAAWPSAWRGGLERLTGTGPEDVWASNQAGIFHWDGARWTPHGSPGEVHAIWTPRAGLLFALGYEVTRLPESAPGNPPHTADLQQIMWRWTSGGWVEEFRGGCYAPVSSARDTSSFHGAMWGARSDDAWAILAGAYHWDGERWTRSDGPGGARCIWGPSADDVWVVSDNWGKALDPTDRMHWNGRSWESSTQMPVPLMCGSGAWATYQGGLWRRQVP